VVKGREPYVQIGLAKGVAHLLHGFGRFLFQRIKERNGCISQAEYAGRKAFFP